MFIGLFKECVNKSLDTVPTKFRKTVARTSNWPISTRIPSTQPIKMAIINGLPNLPPFPPGALHDFHYECSFASHNPLVLFLTVCFSLNLSAIHQTKSMHSTCPSLSNHLLQNARVPKFSLMTFRSCLALGNLINGNRDRN